jgi:dihydropteroate synthase
MVAEGAAIIDVGGESTRPGSEAVSAAEQVRRVVPVIEAIAGQTDVPISIDTQDPDVATAALQAGASIINDITALADERMGKLAAEQGVPVVLMHMRGTPATMQVEPHYDDVVAEVLQFLCDRADRAQSLGVARERILLDPGIGFGKTLKHNLQLLKHIDRFVATGYPVLVGTSRKRFLGKITGREEPVDRIFGTAATVALCVAAGVAVIRVHDVAAMRDVVEVTQAVQES